MVGKTAFCAAALLAIQPVFAAPFTHEVTESRGSLLRRDDTVVDPPKDITPIINQIESLTPSELEELIDSVKDGKFTKRDAVYPRQSTAVAAEPTTDGPFLSYLDGWAKPGTNENCTDFTLNGPFTSIHAAMGSSNVRGIKVVSASGNATEITAGTETIVDPGLFTFESNERVAKFSIAKLPGTADTVSGFSFETDAGRKYEALTSLITENKVTPEWTDIPVGAGIIARIRGTNCEGLGVFGSFGVDLLDNLDSISITNIDYEGFTNSIMPSGAGTQVTVGSQVVDNRNSSVQQTISLQTTDTITRQRTVTTQSHWQVGGSVGMEGKVGIPLISEGSVKAEFNWQVQQLTSDAEMENSVTTRSGTFPLACPAGKFCTAKAFFTQFKLDVNMNATFTATTKSGATYDWVQSGEYKGADSLAMQFNVTEVNSVS
ncbi:hypothetical protein DBV05_g10109 [Lasiodiplodia theobromae]|uniref:Natterin-like protein n=1 Tax=Lasiodiplodia theobromae TaxID=45133 RepID=A0A5N5D0N9_9PEZI|nr:hypothetical protein DBV05_g10109 [Lasiodiplodia theobromae]